MKRLLIYFVCFVMFVVMCPIGTEAADASAISEINVGIPIEERPELFLSRSMPTHGDAKIAVFLIEFPDYQNENAVATRDFYENFYFGEGIDVSWDGREQMSVASFYREQSYGKLNISGQVFDWYTAEHERSYYDHRKEELIMEAAEHYAAQGVDFSKFDGNGDGIMDAITFHFAGQYSSDSNNHWYSGVEHERGGVPFGEIGGLQFITYVQLAEAAQDAYYPGDLNLLSITCHELGHTLGLPDLYGNVKPGMNPTFDLMSKNRKTINPYTKILLGWIDTVQVITGNAEQIRLEKFNTFSSGSVAIVCEEFNGFFDEFYVVAFRELAGTETASVWHIDARVNQAGTAFLYNNLTCDPTPEEHTNHSIDNYSPYAFIEELSGDSSKHFLIDFPEPQQSSFLQGGVIGPNSIPSSDTHDGKYTGIKIDNFVLYDESEHEGEEPEEKPEEAPDQNIHTYITFDVSFVEDNVAPTVLTQDDELIFQNKITITLSEAVYQGAGWDGVKVTDLNGNELDATVYVAHYPRNTLKIFFADESYKNGYMLILPENAVRDSSGNSLKATVLTAKPLAYLFSSSSVQIPSSEYTRNNAKAHFFITEEGFDVITALWEYSPVLQTNVFCAKLELMRFDRNGNVIGQYIVDNPIKNCEIEAVSRTDDGYYFVFCSRDDDMLLNTDSIFCIDSQGNIQWKNEELRDQNVIFSTSDSSAPFNTTGGMVVSCFYSDDREGDWLTRFDTKTGEATRFVIPALEGKLNECRRFDIGNGQILCEGGAGVFIEDRYFAKIQILDSTTFEVITENYIVADYGSFQDVYKNSDGTFMVLSRSDPENVRIMRMDAGLNIIGAVTMKKSASGYANFLRWYDNDGFFIVDRVAGGGLSHSNAQYHVMRYNKFMERVWETDIEASFFEFFPNANGELICYRSMYKPERECYIDYYGSDADLNPAHTHTLVYRDEKEASCTEPGNKAFWQCTDCGVMFSDEGRTVILNASGLFSASLGGHQYGEWTITVNPTCQTDGQEESVCLQCGDIKVIVIPASDYRHSTQWVYLEEPTCVKDGLYASICSVCNQEFERQILPASDKYHVAGEWEIVTEATCCANGLTASICTICSKEIAKQTIPASDKYHVAGEWQVIKDATCLADGISVNKCTVCEKEIDRKTVKASSVYHVGGEWKTTKEPTEQTLGQQILFCRICGTAVDMRPIEKLSNQKNDSTAIVVIVIGVVSVATGAAFLLKKKKVKK